MTFLIFLYFTFLAVFSNRMVLQVVVLLANKPIHNVSGP